ncbi:ATP-binding protein [Brevibacillus sp. H7]|uniref:ATP-binding protein n=1 Tax=Brevibacillus sp. H7 TaxID=3349138 RepID=UPI0037FAE6A3
MITNSYIYYLVLSLAYVVSILTVLKSHDHYIIEFCFFFFLFIGTLFASNATSFTLAIRPLYKKTKAVSELTKEDYSNLLRQQQGMTFAFVKDNNRFIHTVCDGKLLYRLGLKPEDVVGKELYDFLPQHIASQKEIFYQRAWNGQEDVAYEGCMNDIVYLATLRPVYKHGQVVQVISSCIDITTLKQTLSALHESEERFRQIAENIDEVFWIADPVTQKFLYLSPAYEKVWGLSCKEFFQDPNKMFNVIHPEDRERIVKAQEELAMGTFHQEYRIIRPNGTVRWIRDRGFPVIVDGKLHRIVGIAEDITDIRDSEEFLIKSEKLAVLGELAAGIAHEIRNPLTSLRGFVQLLQKQPEVQNAIFTDIMLSEINRINEIVGDFLVLAKPTASNYMKKDICAILRHVIFLMESICHLRNINMEHTFDCEQYFIECEENHVKQVFLNIIKNAMDAMPNGGKVTIEVKQWNQQQIRIRIKDNGCGIPEERMRSIGEPFYTTKEKGTGLGLMVSYRIIQNHKGKIEITSKVGQGTIVDIVLPLTP